MNKRITLGAALLAATLGLNAQKPMTAPSGGKAISDETSAVLPMADSMLSSFRTARSNSTPASATDGDLAPHGRAFAQDTLWVMPKYA